MTDVAQFLLARIDEDESTARYALSRGDSGALDYGGQWFGAVTHAERWEPTRVLAECEAKRQMLGLLEADVADPRNALRRDWAAEILRGMGSVYANHPDYRQEWRP